MRARPQRRQRTVFLRTLVMALLAGVVSALLWTTLSNVISGPVPVLAQTGDQEQATPTQEIRYVQISVEAFLDVVGVGGYDCPGCNGVLDAGDLTAQAAAPAVEIVVRDGATGVEITRKVTEVSPGSPIGRAFFSVPERELLVLELVEIPAGTMLCPNSPRNRVVRPAEFGYGVINHTFTFWQGCSAASSAATATPVPVETVAPPPTDTPMPTDTPVPTATPPSVPTLTPTPLPSPTEEPEPTPTAISIALQPPTPTPPPTPTEAPPPVEPTQPAAPTPTLVPATSTPVSEEPTTPPPGEPTPVPTEIPGPAIGPSIPDEASSVDEVSDEASDEVPETSPAAPVGPDRRAAVRALSLSTDQQDLQRAIARALSEREGTAEGLDAEAVTEVLARAVEIRVDERSDEMWLVYEMSLRQERRQGMLMAFFTGVAGVFTASFWKTLIKALLVIGGKAMAAASPGWGAALLVTASPLTSRSRRQCGTCQHYQPSNMRGQGWCRNPRLYARHVRHLVAANDLDCARAHLPDLWEAVEEQVELTH